MREDSKLKVLGFIFGTDLKKTTADNYERIINTINFMINQEKKVWFSNEVASFKANLLKKVGDIFMERENFCSSKEIH
jgi:hypothetical protein